MSDELVVKFRYFPGDALIDIKDQDLQRLAKKHGVSISMQEVKGKRWYEEEGQLWEETLDCKLDDITQTTVTLSSDNETAFRRALRELIDTYRCPRNTPARWGSNERGEEIYKELADAFDGWD